MTTELILGGARSGKSKIAEERARATGLGLLYIATGEAGDDEMASRIAHHRERRGNDWIVIEEPILLAEQLQNNATEENCILVDCLTLWISNCLFSNQHSCWEVEREKLLTLLPTLPGQIIFVSNEVGMGVVPMGKETRLFVDESGWFHQRLAEKCDRATFIVAGLSHTLKGSLSD